MNCLLIRLSGRAVGEEVRYEAQVDEGLSNWPRQNVMQAELQRRVCQPRAKGYDLLCTLGRNIVPRYRSRCGGCYSRFWLKTKWLPQKVRLDFSKRA